MNRNVAIVPFMIGMISTPALHAQQDAACHAQKFGKFSEWSKPVSLGPVVNSERGDQWPAISPNGLSLYFASNRTGGLGSQDIYVTHRASLDEPWGQPKSLGPAINSDSRDNAPVFSSDGHWLVFSSARTTGRCSDQTGNDIFISHRVDTEDDFAWEPAVNFGCELSGVGENAAMTFFEDETAGTTTLFFASNRPGGLGQFDIYSSTRKYNGAFTAPVVVSELSSPLFDVSQSVRRDGLEMFLVYGATQGPFTDGDLWVSTRETTSQPWSKPVNLGPGVNTDADDSFPSLSCDGTSLYFASTRTGGLGADDLYVMTRKRLEDVPAAPVLLLSLSGDGSGQGAILHAGTPQMATSSNPAVTGELLEIYCTGLIDGGLIPPEVYIGGRPAQILFFGKAPGSVGANQVNVRVPGGISPGPAVPVGLTYLGRLSNEVTIGVR